MFEIEHDIPIPPPRAYAGKPDLRFPFGQLKPGDSFFVPGHEHEATLRASVGAYTARCPTCRFIVRKQADGLRVWRKPE